MFPEWINIPVDVAQAMSGVILALVVGKALRAETRILLTCLCLLTLWPTWQAGAISAIVGLSFHIFEVVRR